MLVVDTVARIRRELGASALARLGFGLFDQLGPVLNLPKPVSDATRHRGDDAECLRGAEVGVTRPEQASCVRLRGEDAALAEDRAERRC